MTNELSSRISSATHAAELKPAIDSTGDPVKARANILFMDSEFIPGTNLKVLSAGLWGVGVESYYYGELPRNLQSCRTPFVAEMVGPQLGVIPDCDFRNGVDMANDLFRWLQRKYSSEAVIVVDSTLDSEVYGELASLSPRALAYGRPSIVCIGSMFDTPEFDDIKEVAWDHAYRRFGVHRHHALADALALRACFSVAMAGRIAV